MGLFRWKSEFDAELESRVDRLESECRQAKLHCESLPDGPDKQNRLKDVEVAEQAVAEARAEGDKAARVRAALRAEAELCLTKPMPLLVPTANRLREKLYRLDSKRHEAWWEKYLDRVINDTRDGDAFDEQAEQAVRFRLKSLTYESTEAAERHERLAGERSSAIQIVLAVSLVNDRPRIRESPKLSRDPYGARIRTRGPQLFDSRDATREPSREGTGDGRLAGGDLSDHDNHPAFRGHALESVPPFFSEEPLPVIRLLNT